MRLYCFSLRNMYVVEVLHIIRIVLSDLDPIELQSGYDVNESLLVGFGGKDTLKIVHSRLKFHNPMQLYLFSTVN